MIQIPIYFPIYQVVVANKESCMKQMLVVNAMMQNPIYQVSKAGFKDLLTSIMGQGPARLPRKLLVVLSHKIHELA